jgi:hypothetical protein
MTVASLWAGEAVRRDVVGRKLAAVMVGLLGGLLPEAGQPAHGGAHAGEAADAEGGGAAIGEAEDCTQRALELTCGGAASLSASLGRAHPTRQICRR